MSWEKLDAGSVLSHTFELEANEKGFFSGAPAHITFRILSSAVLLEAYSTPLFPLDILADKPAESNLEMAKRLLAAYGQKVSVVSIVALFALLITSPSKSSSSKGTKKRR